MTGEEVFAAYRAGDEHASQVVDTFAEWIAVGLASLTNICDPEIFVIGGGVVESLADTIDLVVGHLGKSLYSSDARPLPKVCAAELGERAGAIGAALLAAGGS
jgi:predicted NBD/HSP70 family sugar kinase